MGVSNPGFVFIELAAEHGDQIGILESAAATLSNFEFTVHAWAPAGRVACLEPGTVSAGLLIASCTDQSVIEPFVTNELLPTLQPKMPSGHVPTILKVSGLPPQGLPDSLEVPTLASVPRAPMGLRNALMVIRGSTTNSSQIDKYRDVILPMLKERGGYYEVFALGDGEISAISGSWDEEIFAISRWPTRASAEDFWFSSRYQREAIPLRIGAGKFSVHLIDQV